MTLVPLLAAAVAGVAACADLRWRRIPNWLTLGTAVVGLALNFALGGVPGGLISAVILLGRGRLMLTLNELVVQRTLPSRSGATAPYAVAIASGVYLSILFPVLAG